MIRGDTISSIIYKVFIEGRAIKTNKNAGIDVQNTSVWCDSSINRLNLFISIDIIIIDSVNVVILIIRIIVWSWKKDRCSIRGEFLFCIPTLFHIGIYSNFSRLIECVVYRGV